MRFDGLHAHMSSSEAASTRGTSNAREERAALEGMLRGYPVEQLVEEVMTAWEELAERNDEVVEAKQRLRVMELDLAERADEVAPEVKRLKEIEQVASDAQARIVHLERLLEDAREEDAHGLGFSQRLRLGCRRAARRLWRVSRVPAVLGFCSSAAAFTTAQRSGSR